MPAILNLGLHKLLFPSVIRDTEEFQALSKSQSDWRAAQKDDTTRRDLFAALLEARDPETGTSYTPEELIAEAGILIVAGSDTTATSLSATFFYLLHNQNAYARVREEVHRVFANLEDIRIGAQLASCKYMYACIDEAMRMAPAVGAVLPREILKGGLVVEGHHFPQGVDIGVASYALHHDEAYFPDPFTYNPERWLADADDGGLALAQAAFVPFSTGRTSCVGKHLAYHEMGIVLARVLWGFEMRLEPGSTVGEGREDLGEGRKRKNEFQTRDKFVSAHDGPMVEFRRIRG